MRAQPELIFEKWTQKFSKHRQQLIHQVAQSTFPDAIKNPLLSICVGLADQHQSSGIIEDFYPQLTKYDQVNWAIKIIDLAHSIHAFTPRLIESHLLHQQSRQAVIHAICQLSHSAPNDTFLRELNLSSNLLKINKNTSNLSKLFILKHSKTLKRPYSASNKPSYPDQT